MSAAAMEFPSPSFNFRAGPLVAGLAAWVLVLVCGWWFIHAGDAREISHIQVDGDFQRVSAQTVRAALGARLYDGFIELQLDQAKADLEKLPWVARARVERSWPAGLRVRIWEREAFALWGDASLIDTQGHVFTPAAEERPQHLPRLHGAPGQEAEVLKLYARLNPALADSPFAISGLSRDARGEWIAQTHAGIDLRLGQAPDDAQLDLLRGIVAQSLAGRMSEVDYVDLRYTNGFAVGWKQPAAAVTGEKHG